VAGRLELASQGQQSGRLAGWGGPLWTAAGAVKRAGRRGGGADEAAQVSPKVRLGDHEELKMMMSRGIGVAVATVTTGTTRVFFADNGTSAGRKVAVESSGSGVGVRPGREPGKGRSNTQGRVARSMPSLTALSPPRTACPPSQPGPTAASPLLGSCRVMLGDEGQISAQLVQLLTNVATSCLPLWPWCTRALHCTF